MCHSAGTLRIFFCISAYSAAWAANVVVETALAGWNIEQNTYVIMELWQSVSEVIVSSINISTAVSQPFRSKDLRG
jgi:hypothetical protein